MVIPVSAQMEKTAGQENPEKKEIRDFSLTADRLNKYEAATKTYNHLTGENHTLKKQLSAEALANGKNTITGGVVTIEAHPPVVAAIQHTGLSTHDYVVMTYTLVNLAGAVRMKKQGAIKEYPPSVSPPNAAFVERNYDRIAQILANAPGLDDSKN